MKPTLRSTVCSSMPGIAGNPEARWLGLFSKHSSANLDLLCIYTEMIFSSALVHLGFDRCRNAGQSADTRATVDTQTRQQGSGATSCDNLLAKSKASMFKRVM